MRLWISSIKSFMNTLADLPRIVVITGASHGIGAACAEQFLANGDIVYGLCRSTPSDDRIRHIPTDLKNDSSVKNAIDQISREFGRIDVLLLNAGIGISGAVEFTDLKDAQHQFDVCYFGSLRVLVPALSLLRESKGMVLFTSSVASVTPIPFQAHYSACKAAINALVSALRNELHPHQVRVAAILPGDVKTDFTGSRKKDERGSEIYPALMNSVAKMEHDEQHGMDPSRIARKFLQVSRKRNPKPYYSVGFAYQAICVLVKVLPSRLAAWIIRLLYA